MKYTALKIDMDYCSDPIWVSEDGICFANGSLCEFEDLLSKPLLHGLELYRSMWGKSLWSKYLAFDEDFAWPGKDLVSDCIDELQIALAAKLKEELPHVKVLYGTVDKCGKFVNIEISSECPKGISHTLVG